MNIHTQTKLTGALLVAGALLVNIPYTLLVTGFNYPEILRLPAGEIMTAFLAGGPALILTWLAFAWSGLPLLFALLLLPRVLQEHSGASHTPAAALGVSGALFQIVGLLRWVFVVPVLAQIYTSGTSSAVSKEAAVVVFQAVHQFGGVLLGEHLGQIFTILWMALLSLGMLRGRRLGFKTLPTWLGWGGLVASAIYLLAQGELFATVIPGVPQVGWAGLVGSLLWLAWMAALGILLLLSKARE